MSFTTIVGGIQSEKTKQQTAHIVLVKNASFTFINLLQPGHLKRKIDEMLERKQSLNNAVITSDSWMTELSTDELKELLGV